MKISAWMTRRLALVSAACKSFGLATEVVLRERVIRIRRHHQGTSRKMRIFAWHLTMRNRSCPLLRYCQSHC